MAYLRRGSDGGLCAHTDPEPHEPGPQQLSSPFWDLLSKVGLVLGIVVSIRSLSQR
jgi:hypothetical protein